VVAVAAVLEVLAAAALAAAVLVEAGKNISSTFKIITFCEGDNFY